jgi:hypothetical protein
MMLDRAEKNRNGVRGENMEMNQKKTKDQT